MGQCPSYSIHRLDNQVRGSITSISSWWSLGHIMNYAYMVYIVNWIRYRMVYTIHLRRSLFYIATSTLFAICCTVDRPLFVDLIIVEGRVNDSTNINIYNRILMQLIWQYVIFIGLTARCCGVQVAGWTADKEIQRKRMRSDSVLWKKPLHSQKNQKSNLTT